MSTAATIPTQAISLPLAVACLVILALIATVALLAFSRRRQHRAMCRLRASEVRYRDFAAASSDYLWETDAEQGLVGLSAPSDLGRDTPGDRTATLGVTDPAVQWWSQLPILSISGPFRGVRFALSPEGGGLVWYEASGKPLFDGEGVFGGFRGTLRDVTDLVESQVKARSTEARLAYVLENFSEAIAIWDKDNRFVACNSAFRERFKIAAEYLAPGADFRTMLEMGVQGGVVDLPEGGEEAYIEERVRSLRRLKVPREFNHKGRWLELSEQVLPDGGLVTCYRDVTEHKLQEERAEQSQRLEAVGLLTGGVAHEFNNILAIVQGALELIETKLPEDDDARPLMLSALMSARRGGRLTHQLLAFARRQWLQPRAIELGAFVANMDELLRSTLGDQIELAVVKARGPSICEVDPSQLEIALLNLAANAREAMSRGGRLTIETGECEVEESASVTDEVAPGHWTTLTVSDSGRGIAPEVLPHIFEPFFSTKSAGMGSGLGLSMVHGFVKQSGGHVEVRSRPDEGTTFRVLFPRVHCAAAVADPTGVAAT